MQNCNLLNLSEEATCFKNPVNSLSISLCLINRIQIFHNAVTLEVGIVSDSPKMIATVLKVITRNKNQRLLGTRIVKNGI